MGIKAEETLDVSIDELPTYLRMNHSAYMKVGSCVYYLTDANSHYWRAQDTSKFNEKKHYMDCSELVTTVSEFLSLPFINGKSIEDVFGQATFYASLKP